MKPNISFISGSSRSKIASVAMFLAAALALVGGGVACGVGNGSGGILGLAPDTVTELLVLDMREILNGEAPADFEEFLDVALYREVMEELGILVADIDMMAVSEAKSGDVVVFLEGEFDFDEIRESLDETGRKDEDYRGYELWEGDSTLALLEDDGYVIVGGSGGVKDVLKSLARDQGLLLQDNEDPMKRMIDRVGMGFMVASDRDCGLDLSGCDATAFAASAGGEFSVEMLDAYVFSSERAAAAAVRDFDDFYENLGDLVDSLVYEVDSDGEFVVVKASVDEDEFVFALNVGSLLLRPGEDDGTGEWTVPLGKTVQVDGWRITVLSVTPDAADGMSSFGHPPRSGNQFFMATLRVEHVGVGSETLDFSLRISAAGPSRVDYKGDYSPSCFVQGEEMLKIGLDTLPGDEITGSLCWEVPSSEADSLEMLFGSSMRDKPVVFALK